MVPPSGEAHAGDPLADFDNTERIVLRVKQGRVIPQAAAFESLAWPAGLRQRLVIRSAFPKYTFRSTASGRSMPYSFQKAWYGR